MKNKYSKEMDDIQLDDESRKRILENIQKKTAKDASSPKINKRSIYANITTFAAVFVLLVMIAYPYCIKDGNESHKNQSPQMVTMQSPYVHPKVKTANPFVVLNASEISEITITDEYSVKTIKEKGSIEWIVAQVKESQKTNKMSTQDSPLQDKYLTIEIKAEKNEMKLYAYEDKEQNYIEVPYNGVYQISSEFIKTLDQVTEK